ASALHKPSRSAPKTNFPVASVRPVSAVRPGSPGANTRTSVFAIGLPSGVANWTVTSCRVKRSKAPDGARAKKHRNATAADTATMWHPLASGRHRRRAEASIDTRSKIAMFSAGAMAPRALAPSLGAWHKRRPGKEMPDFALERRCKGLVCGIDEAGRGPLAGPVVAAAAVTGPRRLPKMLRGVLDGSKALTRQQREACYGALQRCAERGTARIGIGAASTLEIDRLNILRAALLAMARAVAVLGARPDTALV